jgi:hypothetical protein
VNEKQVIVSAMTANVAMHFIANPDFEFPRNNMPPLN